MAVKPPSRSSGRFLGFPNSETFVAASGAGCVAELVTHPADTVRVRMQSSVDRLSVLDTARRLNAEGGLRAFYRGIGAVLSVTIPANALYYGSYDLIRHSERFSGLCDRLGLGSWMVHVPAGLCAEFFASSLTVPMEVLKQRFQVQQATDRMIYKSLPDAVLSVAREEGIRGFYRGFAPTFAFFGPFSALFFAFHHMLKERIARATTGNAASHLAYPLALGCGVVSASLAAVIVNPLSVVRTRLQTQDKVLGVQSTHSTWALARSILRTEGLRGFTRGTAATILWMAPSAGISMSLFETAKRWLLAADPEFGDEDDFM